MTPNSFLGPDVARMINSWSPSRIDHIEMTEQLHFKFLFSRWLMSQWIFVQVPLNFVPRNFCSGICLHWSPCKVGGSIKWFDYTQWKFITLYYYPRSTWGHAIIPSHRTMHGIRTSTQQPTNTGLWYSTARLWYSPKTWEQNMAQPIVLAQLQYSLCDHKPLQSSPWREKE